MQNSDQCFKNQLAELGCLDLLLIGDKGKENTAYLQSLFLIRVYSATGNHVTFTPQKQPQQISEQFKKGTEQISGANTGI